MIFHLLLSLAQHKYNTNMRIGKQIAVVNIGVVIGVALLTSIISTSEAQSSEKQSSIWLDEIVITKSLEPVEEKNERSPGTKNGEDRTNINPGRDSDGFPPDEPPGGDEKGTPIGTLWTTYYYLADESTHAPGEMTTIYQPDGTPIAEVILSYARDVCIQGSGKLADGSAIHYAGTCGYGIGCPTGGVVCYNPLDINEYPWSYGAAGTPLIPTRSIAVDPNVISPYGTVIYMEEWDGIEIPQVGGIGGFIHDGCFRADDTGGWIVGNHFDFFSGTPSMYQALNQIHPTQNRFTAYRDPPRCSQYK